MPSDNKEPLGEVATQWRKLVESTPVMAVVSLVLTLCCIGVIHVVWTEGSKTIESLGPLQVECPPTPVCPSVPEWSHDGIRACSPGFVPAKCDLKDGHLVVTCESKNE